MTREKAMGIATCLFPLVALNNTREHVNMSFGKYHIEITAFYDKYDGKAYDDAEYYGTIIKENAEISVNSDDNWDFSTLKIVLFID